MTTEKPDHTEPDLAELQQDYDLSPVVVPVALNGPANGHELPARVAIGRYVNSSTTDPVQVAPADLRRKYLTLLTTETIYVGHSQQLVRQGEAGQLPAGIPLQLPTSEEVWVLAVTTPGVVSFWSGNWSE